MHTWHNYPLPAIIIKNLKKLRNQIPLGSRILLTPVSFLSSFLFAKGYFYGYKVIGISDFNIQSKKTYNYPFSTIDSFSLQDESFDTIVICDLSNSLKIEYIKKNISPNCEIFNLSADYDKDAYKKELASFFYGINFPIANKNINYEIIVPKHWGFGDTLLALCATRKLKKSNPELNIFFNQLPLIREAYGDDLVSAGKGIKVELTCPFIWWEKSIASTNYFENSLLRLGVYEHEYSLPELPALKPFPELVNKKYIILQSRCGGELGLPHLPQDALQHIIDASPLPVYHVGKWPAELSLKHVNKNFQTQLDMLRLIRHASLVLTPRSASAHIAAAYGIPSIVWTPNDILDWHLDYHGWQCEKIVMDENFSSDIVVKAAKEYFHKLTCFP